MSTNAPSLGFRRGGSSYQGERVLAFEETRGKEPWEVEEMRRSTPVSRCPASWKGLLMQDREDVRRARNARPAPKADSRVERARELVAGFVPAERVDVAAMCLIALSEAHPGRRVKRSEVLERMQLLYPEEGV